jgi:hypothetical protein
VISARKSPLSPPFSKGGIERLSDNYLSPPLAGGDKGEGEMISNCKDNNYFHPHPNPPPSRGREF